MTTAPRPQTMTESVAEAARIVRGAGNRDEAFAALRRVVQDVADTLPDNTSPSTRTAIECDLARLWAHFMPRKPRKRARTPFGWCAQAVAGGSDERYYLHFVYVTEAEIIGTDGLGLHVAPNREGLEPGYYGAADGVRLHAPDHARYPDTERVRPDPNAKGRQWHDVQLADLAMGVTNDSDGKMLHYYELPPGTGDNPVRIDCRLLDRLVSMDPEEVLGVNTGGSADSVLIRLSGYRLAVVMPLRY